MFTGKRLKREYPIKCKLRANNIENVSTGKGVLALRENEMCLRGNENAFEIKAPSKSSRKKERKLFYKSLAKLSSTYLRIFNPTP